MSSESLTIKYEEDFLDPLKNIFQKELDYNYAFSEISSTSVNNSSFDPILFKFIKENQYDFGYPSIPIETILEILSKEVPIEEWKNLPDDLTDNLDHYLYGIPKA